MHPRRCLTHLRAFTAPDKRAQMPKSASGALRARSQRSIKMRKGRKAMTVNRRDLLVRGGGNGRGTGDGRSCVCVYRAGATAASPMGSRGRCGRDRFGSLRASGGYSRQGGGRVGDRGRGAAARWRSRTRQWRQHAARRRHSVQKKYGIEDSPDLVFKDLTDWSVVQPTVSPITGTTIAKSFVPSPIIAPPTFEFMLAHGVVSRTSRRIGAGASRWVTRCRARCMPRPWIGR